MAKDQNPSTGPEAASLESINQEVANWLRDLRKQGEKGPWALLALLVIRSKASRRILDLLKERADTTLAWAVEELRGIIADSEGAYDRLFNRTLWGLFCVLLLGAFCLGFAAFAPSVGARSLVIPICDLIISVSVIWLWGRIIPLLVKIGILLGFVEKGTELQLNLKSLLGFPKLFLGGASDGAKKGLALTGDLWHRLGKVPYWFAAGSLYLILVPLHKARFLVPLDAVVIPIFFFGNLAFKKEERAPIWTFINWVCAFLLLDSWLYAQNAGFFQDRIMNPQTVFDQMVVALLTITALAQIGLSGLIATRSVSRGGTVAGYMFPSQRFTQPQRMHPAIIVLLIAAGLWVGLYFMDPSHEPMIPYQWILGK